MECPDANAVQQLVDGSLAGPEREAIEAHVEACATCRRLVAALSPSPVSSATLPDAARVASSATLPDAPRSRASRGAPKRIERYEVSEKLGEGGMGIVYAAYDPELHREIALKLLRPTPGGDDDTTGSRARLLREAQAMARVAHPNVIAVYDVGTWESQVFVAMELAPRGTLRSWQLAAGRSWRAILEAYIASGRGLAAAHAAGLVHRDFKPDNVLVGADGRVRVTDFGLARAQGVPGERAPNTSGMLDVALTFSGAVMGTPAYMAPEQIDGEPTDARSDQFAFCVAAWEALYGARPFAGATLGELRSAIDRGEPVALRARGPAYVQRALARGLAARPADRWPTMDAMLDALAPRRRVAPRIAIAALAIAAVGGGVAFAMSRGGEPCRDAADAMAGVWDDVVRDKLRASFESRRAGDRFAPIAKTLDDYASRWRATSIAACRATRLDGSQSEHVLELRTRCLTGRLLRLQALVAELAKTGAVPNLAKLLAPIERCDDIALLERDPNLDIERKFMLAQVEMMKAFQLHLEHTPAPAVLARGDTAIAQVRALHDDGLTAELLVEHAKLARTEDRLDIAEQDLEEAVALAEHAARDGIKAEALGALADVYAALKKPYGPLATFAIAATERPGTDDAARASGLELRAQRAAGAGKLDEARQLWDQALPLRGDLSASSDNRAALASALGAAGKRGEARVVFEDWIAYLDTHATGEPRILAMSRMLEPLAYLLRESQDFAAAAAVSRREIALYDPWQGSMLLAGTFQSGAHAQLGLALAALGDPGADREFARAVELAGDPVRAASTYTMIAYAASEYRGDARAALAALRRARDLAPLSLGAPGEAEVIVGGWEVTVGDGAAALRSFEQALAKIPESAKVLRASAEAGLGRAYVATGAPARALPLLERVLPVLAAEPSLPPVTLAEARFAVAQALVATHGDATRARTLAEQARDAFAASATKKDAVRRAAVEAWLAKSR